MKKRILALVLASLMLISCLGIISSAVDTNYLLASGAGINGYTPSGWYWKIWGTSGWESSQILGDNSWLGSFYYEQKSDNGTPLVNQQIVLKDLGGNSANYIGYNSQFVLEHNNYSAIDAFEVSWASIAYPASAGGNLNASPNTISLAWATNSFSGNVLSKMTANTGLESNVTSGLVATFISNDGWNSSDGSGVGTSLNIDRFESLRLSVVANGTVVSTETIDLISAMTVGSYCQAPLVQWSNDVKVNFNANGTLSFTFGCMFNGGGQYYAGNNYGSGSIPAITTSTLNTSTLLTNSGYHFAVGTMDSLNRPYADTTWTMSNASINLRRVGTMDNENVQTYLGNAGYCSHEYSQSWQQTEAAGCVTQGVESLICSNCHLAVEVRSIPALGHNIIFSKTEDGGAAPANNGHIPDGAMYHGRKVSYCDRAGCPESVAETGDYAGYHMIFDEVHYFDLNGDPYEVSSTSCTEPAINKYKCICAYDSNWHLINGNGSCYEMKEVSTGTALGHNWGSWNVQTAATCGAAGVKARSCSRCNEVESEAIPATGSHTWGGWVVTTPATVDAAGVETATCYVCSTTKTRAIPKLDPPTENTYVYLNGVSTEIDAAIAAFATTSNAVLTIPADVDISAKTIQFPAYGDLVINEGAIYSSATLTGASNAIISDGNEGVVYGWRSSTSAWVARNPSVSISQVTCDYVSAGGSLISTMTAVQGNIVSKKISAVGVIFIPMSAMNTSAGGLGDLTNDGLRTNADLTSYYLTSTYASCGSMAVSIGASGTSFFQASLVSSNNAQTIVSGWYAIYDVADADGSYFFAADSGSINSNVKPADFA